MKELFESVWKVAPNLMSVIVIVGAVYFVANEVVVLQHRLDSMDKRLTRLEEKVDMIIEYLLRDQALHANSGKQP